MGGSVLRRGASPSAALSPHVKRTNGARISIVVADDHPIMLAGLDALFARESDLIVLARCADGYEALRAVAAYRPRPKGTPNKATLEIKAFARNFLMSDRYRRTLKRRILAGTAPHMEVLLHHYAFGKPTDKYVEPAPPAPPDRELRSRMTTEERREMRGLVTRMREIRQAAGARPSVP